MAKTLNQRYDEMSREIERLRVIYDALDKRQDKIWEQMTRWDELADRVGEDIEKCNEAIRQAVAKREVIVARLMKGKAAKWLPPERVVFASFEDA